MLISGYFVHSIISSTGASSNNLLAARPISEHRRSSHTGLSTQRRTSQSLYHGGANKGGSRRTSNARRDRDGAFASGYTSPRYEANYGGGGTSSNLLLPPTRGRSRGASLPGNMDHVQQEDIYRLRNFATSGKKVINRGDSLKATSKSILNINSAGSRYENVTMTKQITFYYQGSTNLRQPSSNIKIIGSFIT